MFSKEETFYLYVPGQFCLVTFLNDESLVLFFFYNKDCFIDLKSLNCPALCMCMCEGERERESEGWGFWGKVCRRHVTLQY